MVKKQTKEEFVERANSIHNCKYDYSLVKYINSSTKVEIICPIHGVFNQTPGAHINKQQGCFTCSIDKKRLTFENLTNKIIEIYGEEAKNYIVNFDNYKNNSSKINIKCLIHSVDFTQDVATFLSGRPACPHCYVKLKKCSRMDINIFKIRAEIIHGLRYNYDNFEYMLSNIKGKIICPDHGEFLQTPTDHLDGHGCPKCACEEAHRKCILGKEEFIKRANIIHEQFFIYNEFKYVSTDIKGIIICPIHGKFLQSPHDHLGGCGCPSCAHVYSKKCLKWINSFNNPNIKRIKTKIDGKYFEFDGFDLTTNTIYEFYGDFWHGNPRIYNLDNINRVTKQSYRELYEKTIAREIFLKSNGFKLITIWEDEWDKICKEKK